MVPIHITISIYCFLLVLFNGKNNQLNIKILILFLNEFLKTLYKNSFLIILNLMVCNNLAFEFRSNDIYFHSRLFPNINNREAAGRDEVGTISVQECPLGYY